MSNSKMIHCLNCGYSFQGNYCSSCGQKASVKKLTWKSLSDEFIHFFTHAEHSFIYTSRSLFTQPGHIVKEFLDGKRKKVHKPITFVLIWFAIYKIITAGYDSLSLWLDLEKFTRSEPALRVLWHGTKNKTLIQYENFITILIVAPLLVLLGWIVFRNTKTSFIERWVALIYGSAYTTIISTLLATFGFICRIFQLPLRTGIMNDFYLLIYFISIAWFIYSFEKVFQPGSSKMKRLFIAFLMSLVANYSADIIWYILYRSFPE
jgi:hypothetical protein